jgi:hypothetical protein
VPTNPAHDDDKLAIDFFRPAVDQGETEIPQIQGKYLSKKDEGNEALQ